MRIHVENDSLVAPFPSGRLHVEHNPFSHVVQRKTKYMLYSAARNSFEHFLSFTFRSPIFTHPSTQPPTIYRPNESDRHILTTQKK